MSVNSENSYDLSPEETQQLELIRANVEVFLAQFGESGIISLGVSNSILSENVCRVLEQDFIQAGWKSVKITRDRKYGTSISLDKLGRF